RPSVPCLPVGRRRADRDPVRDNPSPGHADRRRDNGESSTVSACPTIAMFGSSLVSAYWNGAATYYRGIVRALHERGYTVTFYEPDAYDRQKHRDLPDPAWANVRVFPANDAGVAWALEDAREADILIKASGLGVY